LGNLVDAGGDAAADRLDQLGHRLFPAAAVGVSVRGDDLSIDHVGDLHGEVLVGVGARGRLGAGARIEQGVLHALEYRVPMPVLWLPAAGRAPAGVEVFPPMIYIVIISISLRRLVALNSFAPPLGAPCRAGVAP